MKQNRKYKIRQKIKFIQRLLILIIIFIGLFSLFTNPFTRFSVIRQPFIVTSDTKDQLILTTKNTIHVYDNFFAQSLAFAKSGWHILTSRLSTAKDTNNSSLDGIIDEIHAKRFNPKLPYLISGDHFSILYIRSLGIFYHTLLDSRTARNQNDWKNRQEIYAKTTAFALETFSHTERLSTTIVPIGPSDVTLINFFSPPSDSLYSLLFALEIMKDNTYFDQTYHFIQNSTVYPSNTQMNAQVMVQKYKIALQKHFSNYLNDVVDKQTGLIRKDITLSSTKDSVKRQSAFYDNVILWKTIQLAQQLAIVPVNTKQLDELKQNIITTFWSEAHGYFLEELSSESIRKNNFSSDWLIAYTSGFLDVHNDIDKMYMKRSVDHMQLAQLDMPFGVKYESPGQNDILHLYVRLATPTYGSTSIWSHWGMEYTKLLLSLYQQTCEEQYLTRAEYQIDAYTKNILRYRGFPELYNANGDIFTQPLYRSVHSTGWIVNFEEAKAMFEWTKNTKREACIINSSG